MIFDITFEMQPNAEQRFMELKEAYETLSDSDRRREYDRINRLGRRMGFFQDVAEDEVGTCALGQDQNVQFEIRMALQDLLPWMMGLCSCHRMH